jgi:TetR/AcrR family transcriptional regulator of autoinduction and epiphytic fitness
MAAATGNAARKDITASGTIDGRTARSDRTHNALVDALLHLLDEGNVRPTAEQIAERAAVSPRSVYQHFPERDGLLIAAYERRCWQALESSPPVPTGSSFDDRLTAVVERRARIWELVSASQRALSGREHFSTEIAAWLAAVRQREQTELLRAFASELDALPRADRARVVAALTAAIAWPTWESLRAHQGLSKREARAAVRHLVARLLLR